MKILKKLRKFTLKQIFLIIIIFVLTGLVRFAILFIPFRYLASVMGKKMADSPPSVDRNKIVRAYKICWFVNQVSDHTPWESKCLVRALTGQLLLRLYKIPNTIYLGICKGDAGKLLAHAWLRSGELVLTGAAEAPGFKEVARFSYNP